MGPLRQAVFELVEGQDAELLRAVVRGPRDGLQRAQRSRAPDFAGGPGSWSLEKKISQSPFRSVTPCTLWKGLQTFF